MALDSENIARDDAHDALPLRVDEEERLTGAGMLRGAKLGLRDVDLIEAVVAVQLVMVFVPLVEVRLDPQDRRELREGAARGGLPGGIAPTSRSSRSSGSEGQR